jgi:hypothetical protein
MANFLSIPTANLKRYGLGYQCEYSWDYSFSPITDQRLAELNNLMAPMVINRSAYSRPIRFVQPKILPLFELSLFMAMAGTEQQHYMGQAKSLERKAKGSRHKSAQTDSQNVDGTQPSSEQKKPKKLRRTKRKKTGARFHRTQK